MKSHEFVHKDTDLNKEFECFMDKLSKLLSDERKTFITDMCLTAFYYIRSASKMIQQLGSAHSQNNDLESNIKALLFKLKISRETI